MHKLILIIFLSFVSSFSLVHSEQLPQTPQIETKQQSKVTPENQHNSQKNHIPTKLSETVPSAQTDTGGANKHNNYGEEKRTEFSVFGYVLKVADFFMVFFTFVLMVFNSLLWFTTEKMWRESKAMSAVAEQQMLLAIKQTSITEKQHDLQRLQHFTMYRPRLIIRRVSLDHENEGHFASDNMSPKIQFIVANIGGSRATIIESNVTFSKLKEPLPAIPPYSIDSSSIKCLIREAGQSDPPEALYIQDQKLIQLISDWSNKQYITNTNDSSYYFFGYINYRDDVGIVRRMTFCRRYVAGTKRFVDVNDPEYEYND